MNKLLQIGGNGFLILVLVASLAVLNLGRRWLATDPRFGAVVLLIASLMILVVVVSFLLGVDKRLKISLALFSASATLFLVNFMLDFGPIRERIQALNSPPQIARAAGVYWDSRSAGEVVLELRDSGREAYRAQYPATVALEQTDALEVARSPRLVPVSGISNVTTVSLNETGTPAIFESDRYGFNNDDPVYDSRNDTPRVLLVGDSFAAGCCVMVGQDVASRLRSLDYNAISLGMGANGPLVELASLKEYGPRLAPDVVLWMYYVNDLNDLRREYKDPTLKQYLADGFLQDLANRQPEINELWKSRLEVKATASPSGMRFFLTNLLSEKTYTLANLRDIAGMKWMTYPVTQEHLQVFTDILRSAKETAESIESEFYFIYLPDFHTLSRPFPFAPSHGRKKVLSIVEELGIPVVDFERVLRDQEDPLEFFPFRASGHYDSEGYALLAELIVNEVLEKR